MRTSLILILLTVACSGDPEATDGAAELRFSVTNGVRGNSSLVDPLVGTVYGNIFLAQDVTLTGPVEGATEYGYIEMANVDLTTAAESSPFAVDALPAGTYMFLGFFDLDGNGAASKDPDAGDPVTLPVDKFDVTPNKMSSVLVDFELVYN